MTRQEFSTLVQAGTVLLDGATGSCLMRSGMPRGVCAEEWVLAHPEAILTLQRAYAAAGSQIIYAPTFGANRKNLERHGLQGQVRDFNRRLAALSKQVEGALIAGDVTTTGVPLEPNGAMTYSELHDIYTEQIEALCEGGVDLLVIETMLGVDETTVALEAARSVCDLPVMCSVTVQGDGACYFGGNCVEAVETLQALGADAVGVNCSCGPEQLVSLMRNMKAVASVPLIAKPNAGMPTISDAGEAVYPMSPEEFAHAMRPLLHAGAEIVGGCCGTTPEFIAALREIIKGDHRHDNS